MSLADFQTFAQAVFDDPALLEELNAAATASDLFAIVIAKARDRGLEISHEDLAAVSSANLRAWLERWLYQ